MITKEQVKEARLNAGLSQEKAAKTVEKTRRTWIRWESGESTMSNVLFKYFTDNT